ncbi:MAG: hypothetical protein PHU25_00885 [Deltaproteobacteria bacterium]|nr:hypothetical protein [Deltaproteobacteria bacterium]
MVSSKSEGRLLGWLLDRGFDESQVEKITLSCCNYQSMCEDVLDQRIENLVGLGFLPAQIPKMVTAFPPLLCYLPERITHNLESHRKIGCDWPLLRKAASKLPSLLAYGPDLLKQKHGAITGYGFSPEQFARIFSVQPSNVGLSVETLSSKLNNLEALGFSRAEVIGMVSAMPVLIGMAETSLTEKTACLGRQMRFPNGYSFELGDGDIRRMLIANPGILAASPDRIRKKLRVFVILTEGNKELLIHWARYWRNSLERIVARARYLQKIGNEPRRNGTLFWSATNFRKRYGRDIGAETRLPIVVG